VICRGNYIARWAQPATTGTIIVPGLETDASVERRPGTPGPNDLECQEEADGVVSASIALIRKAPLARYQSVELLCDSRQRGELYTIYTFECQVTVTLAVVRRMLPGGEW